MSNTIVVMGESGTGKSTSIRTLNHEETFIINIMDKRLPFPGSRKKYIRFSNDNLEGNYYASDNYQQIMKCIKFVNEKRPEIKNLVLDDFQFIMCNEFMRRANEKGYNKFSEIGHNAWSIMHTMMSLRDDLNCFILSHTEFNEQGVSKFKTIGKMLDDKIIPESMYTCVFHTVISDGGYYFLTQNDGVHTAKTPMGMFEDKLIPNDLEYVKKKIEEFDNG